MQSLHACLSFSLNPLSLTEVTELPAVATELATKGVISLMQRPNCVQMRCSNTTGDATMKAKLHQVRGNKGLSCATFCATALA